MKTKRIQLTLVSIATILLTFTSPCICGGTIVKLKKPKWKGIFCLLLLFSVMLSCGGGSSGSSLGTTTPSSLSLIKTVVITTDVEGGSARPEIIATTNRVFVVYLGNLSSSRTFNVKIYDSNLDNVINSKTLISTTSDYGSPTDIRIASDGQYLYVFYETNKAPTAAITYLWGAKYTLDDSFNRVAYTSTPITSSKPVSGLSDGDELVDDPAPLIGPNSVFVITRLKYSISMAGNTIYRVREFSKDNLTKVSEFDLDLSSVANGRGRVTSLLFYDNRIYMALATTVSDQGLQEATDDGALMDIILVKMNQNWTFDPQNDVQTISAEPDDIENYITGLETDGNYFYLTYKQSVGSPQTGEHIAWINIFNNEFNLIHKEKVRSTTWGPGGGELRPSLELTGDRVLSGQCAGLSLGIGNAEIYVYAIQYTPWDPTLPTVPQVSDEGQFTVKSNQLYAQWNSSDPESGIAQYQYRITCDSGAGAVIRDWTSTGTYNYVTAGALSLTNGKTYYFSFKAKNGAGLWSEVGYSDGITVDTTPPIGIISINNGAKYTKTTSVALTLFATDYVGGSGIDKMQFSNDNLTWLAPQAYATVKSWTLTAGDGTKTVYAKFSDKVGNWSRVGGWPWVYPDTIILDTNIPFISNISDSPDPFDPEVGKSSTISFTIGDNLSYNLFVNVCIYNSVGTLLKTLNVTKSAGRTSLIWNGKDNNGVYVPDGTYKYRILAQDMAGNYVYSGYYEVTKK